MQSVELSLWALQLLLLLLGFIPCGYPSARMRCDEARLRCAYRTGCGMALQHYLTGCTSVLHGENCTENCQHALIALTSTDEGKELMTCECENDELCLRSKQRVETCRSSVTRAMNRTRVSCRIATWICNADTLCQTALTYYNRLCKSMFQGRKCTPRCKNSINILTRQEKAAKLNNCQCDGSEEYDCRGVHRNMNILCFGTVGGRRSKLLLFLNSTLGTPDSDIGTFTNRKDRELRTYLSENIVAMDVNIIGDPIVQDFHYYPQRQNIIWPYLRRRSQVNGYFPHQEI